MALMIAQQRQQARLSQLALCFVVADLVCFLARSWV